MDSWEALSVFCADKQHGLMVHEPARTIFSKYTVGSSPSKIQYVSTWRAMSANDLYMAGLVWLRTNPSLWETNGMRGRDRERRTYLFLWKVRPVYGDLLANLRSRRLWEFSEWRWRNHVGYPIGLKSSNEDNLPLVPPLKQDLGNTGGYFENFIHFFVHLCNCMGSHIASMHFTSSDYFSNVENLKKRKTCYIVWMLEKHRKKHWAALIFTIEKQLLLLTCNSLLLPFFVNIIKSF